MKDNLTPRQREVYESMEPQKRYTLKSLGTNRQIMNALKKNKLVKSKLGSPEKFDLNVSVEYWRVQ